MAIFDIINKKIQDITTAAVTGVSPKLSVPKPPQFITPETPIVKSATALKEAVRQKTEPIVSSVFSALSKTAPAIMKYGFEYPSRIIGGRIQEGLEKPVLSQFDISTPQKLKESIEAKPLAFQAIQQVMSERGIPKPIGLAFGFLGEALIPGPVELTRLTKPNILKTLVKETDEGTIKSFLIKETKISGEQAEAIAREVAPLKTKLEVMNVLKPKVGGVPESLAQEARKYKSAEEFVKAQKQVFHGTNIEGLTNLEIKEAERMAMLGGTKKVTPQALFFTEDKKLADFFAKNRYDFYEKGKPTTYERYLSTKKIADFTSPQKVDKIFQEIGADPINYLADYTYSGQSPKFGDMLANKTTDYSRITELFDKKEFVDKLKAAGYDAARMKEKGGVSLAVFKPEQALTKSQLTDIWNQAVKGEKIKAPSPPAKTPDILAEKKMAQAEAELPPTGRPIEPQPTTLLRATEVPPLKETGEQYTTKELSLDSLYKKTGVMSSAVKEIEPALKKPPTPSSWGKFKDSMSRFTVGFKEKIVTDWQRVKELSNDVKLTNELTPYERRKLLAGRQNAQLKETQETVEKIDKDILDTSKKIGIKDTELQNDIFDYLKARHAPERNAALGEKAAGITTKEAGEIMTRIDVSPNAKEVKRIADDLQKFHNETLDILYAEGKPWGVIDKEFYDTLKTKYKNHVPLNRVMETDDMEDVLSGRGLAVRGTGLKRAVGSEKEVRDIMENIFTARTQAIQRIEKNIVDNETYNFVQDYTRSFPEQELFSIVKPHAIGKTFEGKIITEKLQSPDILQFQLNGKPAYIKINDPRLAVAFRGVNREQLPQLMRYIGTVTRWMSALVTKYSAEFPLANKIRDLQEAIVYMGAHPDIGFKGAFKMVAKDPASVKAIKDALLGIDSEGARLYKQMVSDGGTTGGLALSTRKQVEVTLESIRKTARSNPRKAFAALAKGFDGWNTLFEDSTRYSAYKQALEQGVSRNKAAIIAKNVSIDFNEFGTWGPIVNSMYMFANASVQGSAKMIRAMRNPKVATAVIGTVGASVFSANTWNDEIDPEWRSKVSKWDKLNSLNVVIPGTKEFYYVAIPVSWGIKPIKVAMEYGNDLVSGQKVTIDEAIEGIFTAVLEGYNPVGGTDLASALTPSPIEPFVDIARNKQWSGQMIRPDWNKYAPASTQYFKDLRNSTTGKWLIESSRFISKKTGGRIEVSPADADYVLQQITGGPGKFAGKVFNSISAIGQSEIPEIRDIPFLSRLLRKIPQERFGVSRKEKGVEKVLTEQERTRAENRSEAEITFEELKKMPIEQRKEIYKELKVKNPKLIERVDTLAEQEDKGLTRTDRQLLQLGVENGERAKFLFKILKDAPVEERKDIYKNYRQKKIITDQINIQMEYLFTH